MKAQKLAKKYLEIGNQLSTIKVSEIGNFYCGQLNAHFFFTSPKVSLEPIDAVIFFFFWFAE